MNRTNGCAGRDGGSCSHEDPLAGAGVAIGNSDRTAPPARAGLGLRVCDEARARAPVRVGATDEEREPAGLWPVEVRPRHTSGDRPVESARSAASTFTTLSRSSVHSVWCCTRT